MSPQETARSAAVKCAIEIYQREGQLRTAAHLADVLEPIILTAMLSAMLAAVKAPSEGLGK